MTEQDGRAAIVAVIAGQDAAWGKGEAAAFSAATMPDVVFTNVMGMFSVGRAPFEVQHARIFGGFYKGSTLRQTIEHIAFVRPDVAIVDTITEVRGFASLPPGAQAVDGALRTRLEQVMVCDGGEWRVASFHNVPIHPSLIAPAAQVAPPPPSV